MFASLGIWDHKLPLIRIKQNLDCSLESPFVLGHNEMAKRPSWKLEEALVEIEFLC